jgi:hypothetical protein
VFAIWDSSASLAFLLSIIECLEQCQCQKTSAHNQSSEFILASFAGCFCAFCPKSLAVTAAMERVPC